jgi:hypothetical protein
MRDNRPIGSSVFVFTVSRLLSEWQANRAVVKRRGKIVLHSPEGLALRAV